MNREDVMSIAAAIESMKPEFTRLSDSIWDFAELKFEEQRSSGLLAKALEDNDFPFGAAWQAWTRPLSASPAAASR